MADLSNESPFIKTGWRLKEKYVNVIYIYIDTYIYILYYIIVYTCVNYYLRFHRRVPSKITCVDSLNVGAVVGRG